MKQYLILVMFFLTWNAGTHNIYAASIVPNSNTLGLWYFDEGSGSFTADASGRSNGGTLTSGPIWRSTGVSGSCLEFDGTDDYVQVGAPTSLQVTTGLTMAAWICPTGLGGTGGGGPIIINKEGEYEVARFNDGIIYWAIATANPGWTWISTGFTAPLNTWSHIAVTYDGSSIKTYANGTLIHTYAGSGIIGDVVVGQDDFRIGGRQAANGNFKGMIDEAVVYSVALNAGQVQTLYNMVPEPASWALIGLAVVFLRYRRKLI